MSCAFDQHIGPQAGPSTQLMILPKEKVTIMVLENASKTWNHSVNSSIVLFYISNEKKS